MTDNPPGSLDLTPTGKHKHRFRQYSSQAYGADRRFYFVVYARGFEP
jgi:hypothetical protein